MIQQIDTDNECLIPLTKLWVDERRDLSSSRPDWESSEFYSCYITLAERGELGGGQPMVGLHFVAGGEGYKRFTQAFRQFIKEFFGVAEDVLTREEFLREQSEEIQERVAREKAAAKTKLATA